jgi:predicted nucleic acid-binding protein
MGSISCLTDPASLIVIDTSAAINLNATGSAAEILQALPNRLVAVDVVSLELDEGRQRGRDDADLLNKLVSASLIEIVTLADPALDIFETLVVGTAAETLDDGEAATIAYAVDRGAAAIIDERKANRICTGRFPSLQLGCTVDLFAHPDVMCALGRESLVKALINALQLARMRVLPRHLDWVIDLIGSEQASLCASLPRAARSPASLSVAKEG